MPARRTITVGYLVPRILLIIWLADVFSRVAEVGFAAFREPRAIPHSDTPDAPFQPNVNVHVPMVYGDLANMANLRDRSESRSIQFSSDALGFRSTGMNGPVRGAVFGDSFSWSGDKNENSLPAQLGQRLGCRIYNAAGPGYEARRPTGSSINAVAQRIGLEKGLIIVAEVERRSFERIRAESPARARRETFWARVQEFFRRLFRTSPIKRHLEDFLKSIQDGRILPNGYINNVVQAKLRNGDRMLFYPADLRPAFEAQAFPKQYWVSLQRELERSQRKLLVVLIPNKYTVYQGLLAGNEGLPRVDEELMNRNEAALRALNIPVVNLTPVLKAHAMAGIDGREYVYWRNDTHWNSRGISLAADEIVRRLPELKAACG
jgi:hypothetical protein